MSDWSLYSLPLNAEWAAFAATLPPRPLRTGLQRPEDILQVRAGFNMMLQNVSQRASFPQTGLTIAEKSIPVDDASIALRIYTPDVGASTDTFPLIVDIHGGGFMLGDLELDDIKCRQICVNNQAVVVNIAYRLTPEHPFPRGLEDCWSVVKWCAKHTEEIKVDNKKGFIIVGESAGGNFACRITQRARHDPELRGRITGQVILGPVTYMRDPLAPVDENFRYASRLQSFHEFDNTPIDGSADGSRLWKFYNPTGLPSDNPDLSPLAEPSFDGLPPAFIQVFGYDLMRDDGLLYAERLREAKVPLKLVVYKGLPHTFAFFAPHLEISKLYNERLDNGIKWLLSRDSNVGQVVEDELEVI